MPSQLKPIHCTTVLSVESSRRSRTAPIGSAARTTTPSVSSRRVRPGRVVLRTSRHHR